MQRSSSPGRSGFEPATVRRAEPELPTMDPVAGAGNDTEPAIDLYRHLDELVELLRERIYEDIERRGGRFRELF